MNEEQLFLLEKMQRDIEDLRFLMQRKIGGGSADVKANIVAPSSGAAGAIANNSITNAMMVDDSIKQAELDTETVTVTVSAGSASGTAIVTSGSIILNVRPTGNQDQFIDNVAVSGTTLTITLGANATADNTFSVVLLKV